MRTGDGVRLGDSSSPPNGLRPPLSLRPSLQGPPASKPGHPGIEDDLRKPGMPRTDAGWPSKLGWPSRWPQAAGRAVCISFPLTQRGMPRVQVFGSAGSRERTEGNLKPCGCQGGRPSGAGRGSLRGAVRERPLPLRNELPALHPHSGHRTPTGPPSGPPRRALAGGLTFRKSPP